MADGTSRVRLRQAVLVAEQLEPLAEALRARMGLGEPFRDPGVGAFGLANVVFAIGDCFLEIVSPIQPDTAAGRHLQRTAADGGYMVLFDVEDLEAARDRAAQLGVRTVWQIDLPDISGTHLHPADLRGAIVSLDRSAPFGSWRWGGPDWTGGVGMGAPGRLCGITVAVTDHRAVAERWGEVLGVAVEQDEGSASSRIALDGAEVRCREPHDGVEGIVEIDLQLPAEVRAGAHEIVVGDARLTLSDLPARERPATA